MNYEMHWEHNTVMKEKTLTKYNLIYCRKTAIKNFPIKFLSPHESIDSPHFNPQCRLATINGISITVNNIVKEKKHCAQHAHRIFFQNRISSQNFHFLKEKKIVCQIETVFHVRCLQFKLLHQSKGHFDVLAVILCCWMVYAKHDVTKHSPTNEQKKKSRFHLR